MEAGSEMGSLREDLRAAREQIVSQEVTLTVGDMSASSDDPDATLDVEEEPVQPEVQGAQYTGAVTQTVPGYGQGTAPGPPRGPAAPMGGTRSRATVEVEEEERPAGYKAPGQKGSGFTAWSASTPNTAAPYLLPGHP